VIRLLLASRSAGKLRELQPMLRAAGYEGIDPASAGLAETPHEDAIESHATFEANALAKARHFHALTGMPALADDSGLCVDVLGGRPGVRSKRWAAAPGMSGVALDEANNRALLAALAQATERGASFVCAAAYVDEEGELIRRGETRGVVLSAPEGTGGFGYDPYFWSVELGRAFGAVTAAEKGRVSHRGRAVSAVLAALRDRR